MVIIGGADEAVVGDVHQLPQILDALGTLHNAVHELLGADAGLLGLVLDLLAVLVGSGEEHHVAPGQPLIAGHGVGGHGAVGVADVELVRGVIDGGGDIELLLFHRSSPLLRRSEWKSAGNHSGMAPVPIHSFVLYRTDPQITTFCGSFPGKWQQKAPVHSRRRRLLGGVGESVPPQEKGAVFPRPNGTEGVPMAADQTRPPNFR